MQKLGLLTFTSLPTARRLADVDPVDAGQNNLAGDPGRQRLRKVGLLSYASDRPYRIGYDVILSRWGKTGLGRAGRKKVRKIGLLTLS